MKIISVIIFIIVLVSWVNSETEFPCIQVNESNRLLLRCYGNIILIQMRCYYIFIMKFKTSYIKNTKQSKPVTCVGYNNVEDVYYCGDDHILMKWSTHSNETTKICDLSEDLYPTDLHWFPKIQSGGRKQVSDLLVLTSADGKFHLIYKNGRLEKSVEAHKGAALVGQWSYDGAGILTAKLPKSCSSTMILNQCATALLCAAKF